MFGVFLDESSDSSHTINVQIFSFTTSLTSLFPTAPLLQVFHCGGYVEYVALNRVAWRAGLRAGALPSSHADI